MCIFETLTFIQPCSIKTTLKKFAALVGFLLLVVNDVSTYGLPHNIVMASKLKDLTGQVFGMWNVIGLVQKRDKNNRAVFICVCECGTEREVCSANLIKGKTKSCGCTKKNNPHAKIHGYSNKVPEYYIWKGMKSRCYNSNNDNYHRYGGRGITVCGRWRNSFINFYLDMGKRPSSEHSIERINNMGNYEPSNCRWATDIEQGRNQRTNVPVVNVVTGETYTTIAEAAEKSGMNHRTLRNHLVGITKNKTNFELS